MTRLSVVIPTLNEADYLPRLLDSINDQTVAAEVIVADGGSDDGTVDIAAEYGCEVLEEEGSGPGAGRNTGASAATGEVLLFIDADAVLSHEAVFEEVLAAIDRGAVTGTTTWRTHDTGTAGKVLSGAVSYIFWAVHHIPFMTAAGGYFLFIDASVFAEIGGFDPRMPFNEDHDLVHRAKKHGTTAMLHHAISLSARRLEKQGVIGMLGEYGPPTVYYMLGMKERMIEKYDFETA